MWCLSYTHSYIYTHTRAPRGTRTHTRISIILFNDTKRLRLRWFYVPLYLKGLVLVLVLGCATGGWCVVVSVCLCVVQVSSLSWSVCVFQESCVCAVCCQCLVGVCLCVVVVWLMCVFSFFDECVLVFFMGVVFVRCVVWCACVCV